TVFGCEPDGVDQSVQIYCGLERWLQTLTCADGPGEQRVHLPNIGCLAWWCVACSDGQSLRYRNRRQRVVTLGAVQHHLAQLRRILARHDQCSVATVDLHP